MALVFRSLGRLAMSNHRFYSANDSNFIILKLNKIINPQYKVVLRIFIEIKTYILKIYCEVRNLLMMLFSSSAWVTFSP